MCLDVLRAARREPAAVAALLRRARARARRRCAPRPAYRAARRDVQRRRARRGAERAGSPPALRSGAGRGAAGAERRSAGRRCVLRIAPGRKLLRVRWERCRRASTCAGVIYPGRRLTKNADAAARIGVAAAVCAWYQLVGTPRIFSAFASVIERLLMLAGLVQRFAFGAIFLHFFHLRRGELRVLGQRIVDLFHFLPGSGTRTRSREATAWRQTGGANSSCDSPFPIVQSAWRSPPAAARLGIARSAWRLQASARSR